MKLHSCKIRLAGSLLNEVVKSNVTPAEIILLRVIHGDDAVIDIIHTGNVDRGDRAERARLARLYSKTSPKGFIDGEELVRQFLGVVGQELPKEVEAPMKSAEADALDEPSEEEEVIEPIAIVRTKVDRKTADLTA